MKTTNIQNKQIKNSYFLIVFLAKAPENVFKNYSSLNSNKDAGPTTSGLKIL